ncbi:MAG: hypothetical protein ACRC1F_01005 [Metamycoplasmataceae bacterium]
MTKDEIKKMLDNHFDSLGQYLLEKVVKKYGDTFNITYNVPLPLRTKFEGTILQTCNIRYGDFLENVINLFLESNGIVVNRDKKNKNYDLLFENDNVIYVGEIKIRDNHDSTKKRGQLENLIKKAKQQKDKNPKKEIIVLFHFIDPSQRKNGTWYKKQLEALKQNEDFDDYFICYGDDLYKKFNLQEEWKKIVVMLDSVNEEYINNNYILKQACKSIKNPPKHIQEIIDEILL